MTWIKCLDLRNGGTADGTTVQLWTCNGSAGQKWVDGDGNTIRNPGAASASPPTSEVMQALVRRPSSSGRSLEFVPDRAGRPRHAGDPERR